MNALTGCFLIDKRPGVTSRTEVSDISHKLHERRCGHIGTLDPFATGLLIVLVGRATKISPFLERADKTYIATLKLGQKTDSGDLDGTIIEEKEIPSLTNEKVEEILTSFLGEQEQVPPMYSALKKDGRPLYDYARKGEVVERKARKINIFNIKLLDFNNDIVVFEAHVSKGTYIRTLGEDIAEKLGTVGHLIALRRTTVGEFKVSDAIESKNASTDKLISVDQMLSFMPTHFVEGKEAFQAINGVKLNIKSNEDEILVKDKDGIIAVYKKSENGLYSCLRGFR